MHEGELRDQTACVRAQGTEAKRWRETEGYEPPPLCTGAQEGQAARHPSHMDVPRRGDQPWLAASRLPQSPSVEHSVKVQSLNSSSQPQPRAETLRAKVDRIKEALGLDPELSLPAALRVANESMELVVDSSRGLPSQADALLEVIGI